MVAQQVLVLFVQVRILVVQPRRSPATKVVGLLRFIREGKFKKRAGVLSEMSARFLIFVGLNLQTFKERKETRPWQKMS